MDGLLEPADAEDIRKKIDASKFATDMFHRIREVMRRLRLTAPSLAEHGTGLDPNTVADYLDNVLSGDQVPDFEKVCLESDVYLAEVASCHQILALVLGEPVEIDPAARERMYRIPQVAGQAEEERQAAAAAAALLSENGPERLPVELAGVPGRAKPAVPEYLREPRKRRLLPIAAALLLCGGVLGVLLVALWQFQPGTLDKWWDRLRGRAEVAAAPQEPEESAAPAAPSAAESNAKKEPAPAGGAVGPGESPSPKPVEPPKTKPDEGPAVINPAEGGGPGEKAAPVAPGKPAAAPAAKQAPAPPPGPAKPASPVKSAGVEKPAGAEKPAGPAPVPPEPAPEAVRIARVFPDALEVLLRYNADNATWTRAAPEEFLQSGQPLLALPTYRPRVVLLKTGGITAELLGGTEIQLLPPDTEGRPGIHVVFGRVVVKPLDQAPARLRLTGGGRAGVLTLGSLESICALEVVRVQPPGVDPQTHPAGALATLYVAQNGAVWEDDAMQRGVRLAAPAQASLEAPAVSPEAAPKTPPKWIFADAAGSPSSLERRAATTVAQAFSPDRPASLVLLELAEHRQVEVRWLATRCLAYLGQFEPMTAALDDKNLRWQWPEYVDQLRQAIIRGPASAGAVRQAIEKRFGPAGQNVYRMLWGYTDRQLAAGEDARLVNDLDSETLAVRVLAFWNLKDITGTGFFYRPEDPAAKRQQAIQRWKQFCEAGSIRVKTAEDKSRVAADAAAAGQEKPAVKEKPAAAEKPAAGEKPAPGGKSATGEPVQPHAVPEPPVPHPPVTPRVIVPEPEDDSAEQPAPEPRKGAGRPKPAAADGAPPPAVPPEPAP
jgi:hypothetical protein